MPFAELAITSNFTFLTGASHPEEYAREAAAQGLAAFAIADRNSVAGIVRAHQAIRDLAREGAAEVRTSDNVTHADVVARARNRNARGRDPHDDAPEDRAARAAAMGVGWQGARPPVRPGRDGPEPVEDGPTRPAPLALPPVAPLSVPRLIPAAGLELRCGQILVALPTDRAAWGRLTRLLTVGKRRAAKGECRLEVDDVLAHAEGMLLLWRPTPCDDPLARLRRWTRALPGQVMLLAAPAYDGRDAERLETLAETAEAAGAPMVASAAPLMHRGARRRLADVLSCIREGTTIDRLGRLAQPNAERRLRSEAEMRRLFAGHEAAVDRAGEVAAACAFSLDELRYEYPDEVSEGEDPQVRLARLTHEGLAERYPDGVPERARALAGHELALIGRLGYARYFLTVRDLVAFAESRGILCQGRGSAANSVVCYALRVTAIGPEIGSMVFERFVSEARDEPPDIDVDFEHERREEVIQHIYERYGRHRAGLCATVIHYRARRAIREVGKAMGLSADAIGALASQIWGWSTEAILEARIREVGLDPDDPRLRRTLDLVEELIGFPRHLSQHVGGFVMTRGRLDELVPIENAAMDDRTVIEWDKDDIDALGILKVDVLSLGMLTCIRKAFELIARHGGPRFGLATLPPEDPAVYDMLCEADSIGVFQVESRAQMNFLPRMRPRCFYDLVIQVAIVRPGPIQGDMVHPYLRRRRGEEKVAFPSDALGEVLGKTLGVPLFQEQAMQIAIIGAGFDPSEADRLRRALATFRKSGTIHNFRERFEAGMLANGYDADFAARCFSQIEGFGEYGFPESHAASFALLVYASAWIKRHHPAAFACALLNAQPMGFYAPAQIVRDARAHGVEVRPVCVNASYWDCTLEPTAGAAGGFALRLGLRQMRAMREEDAHRLAAARGNGYRAVDDVQRKAGLGRRALETLAEADAFAALGLSRREALWAAKAAAGGEALPLFAGTLEGEGIVEPAAALPEMSEGEAVVEDYAALRLSLRAHPLALLRARLTPETGAAAAGAAAATARAAQIFAPPAGSAGAAHFAGAGSLARARRAEALRSRAEAPEGSACGRREGASLRSGSPSAGGGGASLRSGPPAAGKGASLRSASPAAGGWPRPPSCTRAALLHRPPDRARVSVAGLVIVRQRPGSAKGVIFVTLEDETGVVNVIVWSRVYERFRREVIAGRMLRVTGTIQREGKVVHVAAERIEDLSALLDDLSRGARAMPDPAGPTDEARRPVDDARGPGGRGSGGGAGARHPRQQAGRLFPSRDFH